MIRHIVICVFLAASLTGPALAGDTAAPKPGAEARDSAQVTRRNINKMKLRTSVLKRVEISACDAMP